MPTCLPCSPPPFVGAASESASWVSVSVSSHPCIPQLAEEFGQLRQERARLRPGEVALVDEFRARRAHVRAAAVFEARRAWSSSASDSPIVRSWPWKARCQWSGGHFRTCSSSVTSDSAGTKSSSGRTRTGSASTPPGIRLVLALLAGPDRGAVLEHLRLHPRDSPEGLDAGDVEEDLVARLELIGLSAAALLEPDQVEAPLDVDPEVLERPGEDPAGRALFGHGTILCSARAIASDHAPQAVQELASRRR